MTTTLASPPQAATFDLDTTCRFGADALAQSDYRRAVSRADPLAFALLDPPHHLRGDGGRITFSEFHRDLPESTVFPHGPQCTASYAGTG